MGVPEGWQARLGPAWVEIDLDAIASNVGKILDLLGPSCRLLAVVKANAYGHGAAAVAACAVEAGASGLGVSTVAEALGLRAAGIAAPVLVFTPPRPTELQAALEADLTLTVPSLPDAQVLAAHARRARRTAVVHLKCDAGMGRYGLTPDELANCAAELAALGPGLRFEGVYTHFPRGADRLLTTAQLGRFLAAVEVARAAGLPLGVRHAAASSATLAVPEARLEMVRIGNLLYGETPSGLAAPAGLRRAFAVRVQPAQIRVLPAGASVGYGREWRASGRTDVATLPIGYADGMGMGPVARYRRPGVLVRALARALLARLGLAGRLGAAEGEVVWGGRRVAVLGRIGMQQVTVDASAVPADRRAEPATIHLRATATSPALARVYLRDGIAVRAVTPAGMLELSRDLEQPG